MGLYEQVVLELLELREFSTAGHVLKVVMGKDNLRNEFPDVAQRLDYLHASKVTQSAQLFGTTPKQERKKALIADLRAVIQISTPKRLLTIIGKNSIFHPQARR